MLVELKSNGTQHEIKAKDWENLSRDNKMNYKVISKTDTVTTVQVAENSVEKKSTAKDESKNDSSTKG